MSTSSSQIASQLAPLLAAAHRLGSRHVTLFGSAAHRPLAEVADLDLHLVLPRLDRSAFDALVAAAGETAQALAAGRPYRVELRHGPFKPAPGDERAFQLHLLLDDEESAAHLPCALLAHRAATGKLLAGKSLLGLRKDCGSPAVWLREAREELERWREALAAREIPCRHWLFEPEPRLVRARATAAAPWDLECLLRGAGTATDLHYRATLWAAGLPADDDLARPLLSQLHDEPPWQSLDAGWDRVRDEATAILERRLGRLAEILKDLKDNKDAKRL